MAKFPTPWAWPWSEATSSRVRWSASRLAAVEEALTKREPALHLPKVFIYSLPREFARFGEWMLRERVDRFVHVKNASRVADRFDRYVAEAYGDSAYFATDKVAGSLDLSLIHI